MKSVWFMSCALALTLGCSSGTSGPDKPAQSAAPAASSAAAPASVTDFLPGTGIGPVRIGMSRAELDGLGLPVKPGPSGNDVTVGPYVASMDGDRVGEVQVELRALPGGARIGGKVFDPSAKIEAIAEKLRGCSPMKMNEGANVITCEAGRARLIAGGPPGIVSIHSVSEARAAKAAAGVPEGAGAGTTETTWKHPGMDMTLSYPDKLLKVAPKPDGATLTSEILGTIEDRSGEGKDRPSPLRITISVRVGKLMDVVKSSRHIQPSLVFPNGTEASFKEEAGFAEKLLVAGAHGYRISSGSHDQHQDVVYAELKPGSTLEVLCDYVGDMVRPTVPMATQKKTCDRVVGSLTIKL